MRAGARATRLERTLNTFTRSKYVYAPTRFERVHWTAPPPMVPPRSLSSPPLSVDKEQGGTYTAKHTNSVSIDRSIDQQHQKEVTTTAACGCACVCLSFRQERKKRDCVATIIYDECGIVGPWTLIVGAGENHTLQAVGCVCLCADRGLVKKKLLPLCERCGRNGPSLWLL